MAKDEKKKLIKVEGYPDAGGYTSTSVGFAFVNKTGEVRRQCTQQLHCRDYFLDMVRYGKTNGAHGTCYTTMHKEYPIDLEKLRLLLSKGFPSNSKSEDKEDFRDRLFSGKKALNWYERLAGFDGTSKITTVNHSHGSNAWLLTGPKEWLQYPTLISMGLLVLRLAAYNGPIEFDKDGSPEEWYADLRKKSRLSSNNNTDVSSYLPSTYDKMEFFIKNLKEILGDDIEDKDIWNSDRYGFYSIAGFVNLCAGNYNIEKEMPIENPFYARMHNKFHELWKKENTKKAKR